MKSLPILSPTTMPGTATSDGQRRDHQRVAQAAIEHRRIPALHPAQQRHVLVGAGARRPQNTAPRRGTSVSARTSAAAIAAITAAASG